MKIDLRDGLPYVAITLVYHGKELELRNVLLDTGSAGTVFSSDKTLSIGLQQVGTVIDFPQMEVRRTHTQAGVK